MGDIFAGPTELALGAVTGLVFGFLLQKGGVTRFNVIVNQFLFRDFTVLKVMLTAIVVGAIGIYGMRAMGMDIPMHIKSATIWMNAIGGLIFGIGMAIAGYCPGTGVAALGDGSRHAWFAVLGMVAGAAVYAELDPWVKSVMGSPDLGKATLASVTHLSVWVWIAVLAAVAGVVFAVLEIKPGRRGRGSAVPA